MIITWLFFRVIKENTNIILYESSDIFLHILNIKCLYLLPTSTKYFWQKIVLSIMPFMKINNGIFLFTIPMSSLKQVLI